MPQPLHLGGLPLMTNYKQQNFYGNALFAVKAQNVKIIPLAAPLIATVETLHTYNADQNYIVPSGKEARIIYVGIAQNSTLVSHKFLAGSTLDSGASPTNLIQLLLNNPVYFHSQAVPSGKYITASKANITDRYECTIAEYDEETN